MKKGTKKPKDKKPEVITAQNGRPFPVPPGGCPDGWADNGSGLCVLNS